MKLIINFNGEQTTLVYNEWPSVTQVLKLDLTNITVILKDVF